MGTEGVRLIAVSARGIREGGEIFNSKGEQWRLVIKVCISAIEVKSPMRAINAYVAVDLHTHSYPSRPGLYSPLYCTSR